MAVCHRSGFRKFYDLTENVIPPEQLNARMDTPKIIDWACKAALDRLGFATSGEIAAFWDLISPSEAKMWCANALATGNIVEIEIDAVGKPIRCFARPDILDARPVKAPGQVRILSPFDPMLRDRKRAQRLFNFDYRIEVFVPEAKRKYGYYVFPVMEGDRIIGRLDAKCDRKGDSLQVRAFWPEKGVRLGADRLKRLTSAIERTARLGKVSAIKMDPDWIRTPLP